MKAWWIALPPLALGMALGIASSWAEFAGVNENFQPTGTTPSSQGSIPPSPPSPSGGPRVVVVNGQKHDFGSMESHAVKSHTFLLKNAGQVPVRLEKGETTCKCTLSELAQQQILPGETAEVTLEWSPTDYAREFHQRAEILAFAPEGSSQTLNLQIFGRVVQLVRPVPTDLTFSNISVNQATTARLRVYGYREDPLQITGYELTNPQSAEFFEVEIQPLSEAERQEESGAQAGFGVTVTAKSGLPLGSINQTIRLQTNLEQIPTVEIPVRGSVVSDISILGGRNFDRDQNTLLLGTVRRHAGAKVNLHVLVKGPHREETELAIGRLEPRQSLQATLGEPKRINQGAVLMYPLTVEIPANVPPVNRMGSKQGDSGLVVIETTHPDAKQVQLLVRFAVGE